MPNHNDIPVGGVGPGHANDTVESRDDSVIRPRLYVRAGVIATAPAVGRNHLSAGEREGVILWLNECEVDNLGIAVGKALSILDCDMRPFACAEVGGNRFMRRENGVDGRRGEQCARVVQRRQFNLGLREVGDDDRRITLRLRLLRNRHTGGQGEAESGV